ncbi:KIF12 family protein [Megaselia abdita]
MVTRATSVPNSIDSLSEGNRSRRNTTKRDTKLKPPPRSRSLTNSQTRNKRNPSPTKSLNSRSSNSRNSDRSGSRNTPILVRSREHEIGSADTLEIIASKSTGSEPSTPDDNVNVVVRVRPLSQKERQAGHESILQFPGNGQVMIDSGRDSGSRNKTNVRVFTYNVVFEPGATQDDILDYSGIKRLIEMAVEGFSCTAFCYGQTGSGKTHTLTGPPDLFQNRPNPADPRHGLIFRAFLYLFQMLKSRTDTHFVLKASFLEIYNEKVMDLLNTGSGRKPLTVRWSKKSGGFFVENLFTVDCEELDDLLAVLEEGMRNRAVGSHQMNDHSSRSHTILTVHIISEQKMEGGIFISKHGKINFVDLAGSEMTKKTMSEGTTLEEANNINKSLMVLGYCIASLSDSKKKSGHIPYRDSQLTKLLADSLAGKGVTLMIACVSPAQYNHAETLNTLRYAFRAKRIRTKPIIIMDPREALILSLKRDIQALEAENEHLKNAINLHHENAAMSESFDINQPQLPIPKIDLQKLTELGGQEVTELVKLYMQENENLRQENNQIYAQREILLRDHEIVSRENEKLLKKLEDVNKVCVRSPLITATGDLSGSQEDNSANIWTNPEVFEEKPIDERISVDKSRPSQSAQRVKDKKIIAKQILEMADRIERQTADPEKRRELEHMDSGYMPDMFT